MSELWHGEVHRAAYRDGRRLEPTERAAADLTLIWVQHPEPQQVLRLAAELDLPDAISARLRVRHSRVRVERREGVEFVALRPARYVEQSEEVQFGEVQVITGPQHAVVISRCGFFSLDDFVGGLEAHPERLALGSSAVLHAALAAVVETYDPVILGLENDVDEIEEQVFRAGHDPLRRIYELIGEVIEFQRATAPLEDLLGHVRRAHELSEVERRLIDDAHERALQARERAGAFRLLLDSVLQVNLALETKRLSEVSIQQAEQMKKISSWAAILFTPTLIGGIYGMNFRHMPELDWQYGYPFALLLMLAVGVILWLVFRRRDWM